MNERIHGEMTDNEIYEALIGLYNSYLKHSHTSLSERSRRINLKNATSKLGGLIRVKTRIIKNKYC